MRVSATQLPEVLLLEPQVFGDARGYFLESYHRQRFAQVTGLDVEFVQDNHSCSAMHVLRGLHYQLRRPQGKLIRVVAGEVYDVAVDLRRSSPRFGHWSGARLSASNRHMLWIPPGFAHGFLALSEGAQMLYKATDYYAPAYERCIQWNDPDIGIEWPISGLPLMSEKDTRGVRLAQAEVYD